MRSQALYRNENILETLRLPLSTAEEKEAEDSDCACLFFISERDKKEFISMNMHSIEHLFDENKMQLISTSRYKDDVFANYCKNNLVNKEMVGKYLIGLQTNMAFWLIDCFQQLSQTSDYHSMHNHVCKIINRFL